MQIGSPAYRKMLEEQFEFFEKKFREMDGRTSTDPLDDWVSVAVAKRLLGVGRTKLQELKNEGQIAFTQHKKTLRFSRKSIELFLKKHSTL